MATTAPPTEPGVGRVSQSAVEVLNKATDVQARASQVAVEVVNKSTDVQARVSQVVISVLRKAPPYLTTPAPTTAPPTTIAPTTPAPTTAAPTTVPTTLPPTSLAPTTAPPTAPPTTLPPVVYTGIPETPAPGTPDGTWTPAPPGDLVTTPWPFDPFPGYSTCPPEGADIANVEDMAVEVVVPARTFVLINQFGVEHFVAGGFVPQAGEVPDLPDEGTPIEYPYDQIGFIEDDV